jgi:hypothetical protein
LINGLAKGAFRFRTIGSHTWSATSKWMNKEGIQLLRAGEERHHWLLEQNQGIGKSVEEWIKNQPWNTNPISKEFNNWLSRHSSLSWLGAPSWVPETLGGAIAAATGSADDCSCSQ